MNEIAFYFLFIILLFAGAIIYHESLSDAKHDKQYITEKEKYDNIVSRIKLWKINRTGFTDNVISQYHKYGKYYTIWVDTKYKTADSSYYEIKGAFDVRKAGEFRIQWRYYIRTRNDKIISIIKG